MNQDSDVTTLATPSKACRASRPDLFVLGASLPASRRSRSQLYGAAAVSRQEAPSPPRLYSEGSLSLSLPSWEEAGDEAVTSTSRELTAAPSSQPPCNKHCVTKVTHSHTTHSGASAGLRVAGHWAPNIHPGQVEAAPLPHSSNYMLGGVPGYILQGHKLHP